MVVAETKYYEAPPPETEEEKALRAAARVRGLPSDMGENELNEA